MKFDYPHRLPIEDAQARLEALGEYLQNKHGINVSWDGRRASFRGKYLVVSIEGTLTLADDRVDFDGKDPGMLWRKKATKYLQDKLALYLDASRPLDALPRR